MCTRQGEKKVEELKHHPLQKLHITMSALLCTLDVPKFEVLKDMLGKFVIAYTDDILIYFPFIDTCITQILSDNVSSRISSRVKVWVLHSQLTSWSWLILSAMKARLWMKLKWFIKDLQQILELPNLYRKYIRGLKSIASPLHSPPQEGPQMPGLKPCSWWKLR